MVILKAMGTESDQEIVQLIGTENEILEILSPTLEEPYNMGIYTQDQVRKRYFHFIFFLVMIIYYLLLFLIGIKIYWFKSFCCTSSFIIKSCNKT